MTAELLKRRIPYLICVILLFMLFISCQSTFEPTDKTTPIKLRVRVIDQQKQLIDGAMVEWSNADTNHINYTNMRNVGIGTFEEIIAAQVIPPGIKTFLRISPPYPPITNDFIKSVPILDRFILCGDSLKTYMFFRETPIDCNGNCDETIDIVCNLDFFFSDTACTKRYVNSTTQAMTVNQPAPLPLSVQVLSYVSSNPLPQVGSLTVQPGEAYWFCFIYTPIGGLIAPKTTYNLTINRVLGGQPCNPCNITLSTEAVKSQACLCPIFSMVSYPADTSYQKICIDDAQKLIQISLSSIRNNNKDCDIIFTPLVQNGEFNFGNQNLRIRYFNGISASNASYVLKAEEFLGTLDVWFSPNQLGRFKAYSKYRVQTRNKAGLITDCPDTLVIEFKGNVARPICSIDTAKSTLFHWDGTKFVLDTITQCVGVEDMLRVKTLSIKNIGECDLIISAPVITSKLFKVQPSSLVIPPGQNSQFAFNFIPTTDSVYRFGRAQRPFFTIFSMNLSFPGCLPNSLTIFGKADTSCHYSLQQCMHRWGEPQGNWNESIEMDENTNAIYYFNDQLKLGARDIFINSINLGNSTAVLASDYASWAVVGNHQPISPNETVCSFGENYITTGNIAAITTGQLPVQMWDVVLFELNFTNGKRLNGVIWITAIELDKNLQGVPQVCIQICYPI